MRVSSLAGDFVELERAQPEDATGDVLILARVRRGQFTASIEAWVLQTAWFAFAQELTILEERRQGEARLEGISPGELELVFRSFDRAGHLGVEGLVGVRTFDSEVSLRFSAFAFDPSQLPILARQVRSVSEDAG